MKHSRSRLVTSLLLAALLSLFPSAVSAQKKSDPASSPLACARYFIDRIDPENSASQREWSLVDLAAKYRALEKPEEIWRAFSKLGCSSQSNLADAFAAQAIKAGRNDDALKFLEQGLTCIKADEDFDRSGGLFKGYIDRLLELHLDERVLAVAEMIEDKSTFKAEAFAALAQASITARRYERAMELLERAFALAKEADDNFRSIRLDVLAMIGVGYTQLNKPEQAAAALTFALQLNEQDEDTEPENVRLRFANKYARAGQGEQALLLIETGDTNDIETLIDHASIYARLEAKGKAYELLAKATRLIESADDGNIRYDHHLNTISHVYLRADDPQQALQIAEKIDHNYLRTHLALAIADWFLTHGQSELALMPLDSATEKVKLIVSERPEEILPRMSTSKAREKAYGLADLAEKYIEAKAYDRAHAAIMAIDLPQRKAAALAKLAGAMTKATLRAKAEKTLDKALSLSDTAEEYGHDERRDQVLSDLALSYAKLGNKVKAQTLFARALEMIRELSSTDGRIERLTEIGFMYEKSGLKADARIKDVLRRIVKEWSEDD